MPSPTGYQMHQSTPLQNYTVAAMQEDADFIMGKVAPIHEVEHRKDSYYEYDTGAYNRLEMRPRGTGDESAGSGWTLSTSDFDCKLNAVHKDDDWDDVADADPAIDPEEDAAEWGANQIRLWGENEIETNFMTTSVWTTDIQGVSSGQTAGTSVLDWSDSSSDPQADIEYLKGVVKGLTGKEPNTLVVANDVHRYVITNPAVRDGIKHTEFTGIDNVKAKMSSYFGLNYMAAGGFVNTAAEGQTTSLSTLIGSGKALLAYVSPKQGKKVLTALKTFAFKRGGRASAGVTTFRFDINRLKVTRNEFETHMDIKQISADCGVYLYSLV